MPPTLPPRSPAPSARPASFPASFSPSAPPPGAAPNPYQAPPAAVPPSEYGPIRDIYDPQFAAGQLGVPIAPDAGDRELAPGRFLGLESRGARRRRTILSGVVTAFVVVLVVGLISFAVWQTQQGDDDPENTVLAGGGTPPVTNVAGDQSDEEDEAAVAGDVAAGAPGETPRPTPTIEDEAAADDDATGDEDPTDEPASAGEDDGAADEEDDDGPPPTPTPNPGGRSLINLVPAEDEVPDGMILTDEGRLDEEDVAATFGDFTGALSNLEDWGWRGNLYRQFERSPDLAGSPDEVNFLVVSVHRFDSEESADEAMSAFSNEVIELQGLEPIELPELGDEAIGLAGNPDQANLVVVYIRTGPYLIRIGGASPQGDPTDTVVELAEVILVNEPD
jgi:hypothetical protein